MNVDPAADRRPTTPTNPILALALMVIAALAGTSCDGGSSRRPSEADRALHEAAVAIARAGDAHARAPERFPGAAEYEDGLQQQRRIDPTSTLSTFGDTASSPPTMTSPSAWCSVGATSPTSRIAKVTT